MQYTRGGRRPAAGKPEWPPGISSAAQHIAIWKKYIILFVWLLYSYVRMEINAAPRRTSLTHGHTLTHMADGVVATAHTIYGIYVRMHNFSDRLSQWFPKLCLTFNNHAK